MQYFKVINFCNNKRLYLHSEKSFIYKQTEMHSESYQLQAANQETQTYHVQHDILPYSAIGLLVCSSTDGSIPNRGTAFAISENILLTCAHNLVNKTKFYEEIYFYPASCRDFKQDDKKKIKIINYKLPNNYLQLVQKSEQHLLFDYACLLLESKLCLNQYISLENSYGNSLEEGKISGFSKQDYSIPQRLHQMQSRGMILQKNSKKNMLFYNMSTKKGSSGSPVLNKNNKVIGIHTHYDKKKTVVSQNPKNPINGGIWINLQVSSNLKKFRQQLLNEQINKKRESLNKKLIDSKQYKDMYEMIQKKQKTRILQDKSLILDFHKCDGDLRVQAMMQYGFLKAVTFFPQIQELNLNTNRLSSTSLSHLTSFSWENLQKVDLRNNQIQNFDMWKPQNFKKLIRLLLSNNSIKQLPKNFIQLENLKELALCSNRFDNIPQILIQMKNSSSLEVNLSYNLKIDKKSGQFEKNMETCKLKSIKIKIL